jgi:predicted transcriptional regulator
LFITLNTTKGGFYTMATLLEMAAEILASHASSTPMSTAELLAELQKIHSTLQALESGVVVHPEEDKTTLSGKQSIKKNEVVCLLCNKGGFKTLTRHLNTAHQVKPKDYKKQFNIPAKQSLSARSLTESRRQGALERGQGDNLVKARAARAANIAAKKPTPAKAVKSKAPVPVVKAKAAPKAKTAKAK